eukprot:UN30324
MKHVEKADVRSEIKISESENRVRVDRDSKGLKKKSSSERNNYNNSGGLVKITSPGHSIESGEHMTGQDERRATLDPSEKIIREGWLNKKSQGWGGWQERYFALHGDGILKYYEDAMRQKNKGEINLNKVSRLFLPEKKELTLQLEGRDEDDKPRTWFLKATEQKELDKWKRKMHKYIPRLKATQLLKKRRQGWMEKVGEGTFSHKP